MPGGPMSCQSAPDHCTLLNSFFTCPELYAARPPLPPR
ncbi:unnamed protein product, partial [Staurois parvus]